MTSALRVPASASAGAGTRRSRTAHSWIGWAFCAAGAAGFLIFVVTPAVAAIGLGFTNWNLIDDPVLSGLANYQRLFTDAELLKSLLVTLGFVALGVIPSTILGFLVACLVNVPGRFVRAVRGFYFAPMAASAAVVAVIATQVVSRRGMLNSVLGVFGIQGPDWLNSTTWALPVVTGILVWASLPLVSILYLSGLQRISSEVLDAAALDGAGPLRRLVAVSWPGVRSTTILVLLLQTLTFISGGLGLTLILTQGGPLDATRSLALYAYQTAFSRQDIGYSSAIAVFQLAIVGVFVVAAALLQRGRR